MSNFKEGEYVQQYKDLRSYFLNNESNISWSDEICALILAGMLKKEEAEKFRQFAVMYPSASEALVHFRSIPQLTEIIAKIRVDLYNRYC
jgi:hypothetical protein